MTTETALESALEPTEQTLAEAFTDEAKFQKVFDNVKAAAGAIPVKLDTMSGRQAVASVAYKIGQLKGRIDKKRLAATEDLRKETKRINDIGNKYKDQLQTLQDTTRAPLTAWEEADKEREGRVDAFFSTMIQWEILLTSDTLEIYDGRIVALQSKTINPDVFQEREPEAVQRRASVLAFTMQARDQMAARIEAEAEAARVQAAKDAELEEFRREKAEREANEAAAAAEREREAIAAREADQREARRIEEERLAVDRAALEEQRAQVAADQEAARQRQAELDQQERERQDAEALKRREEADSAQRQRNQDHRKKVEDEAIKDMAYACGDTDVSYGALIMILEAIVTGQVRHVTVNF